MATSSRLIRSAAVPAVVLLAALVLACSAATPSAAPPSVAPDTAAPSSATADGGSGGPKPTNWPYHVVEGTVALAAADGQFKQVGDDLAAAVNAGDVNQLLTVTGNVQQFLEGNRKNIPYLQGYPETKDLGDKLAVAYDEMIAGVTKIHDSIVSGDAAGVTAGFAQFVAGNTDYSNVRDILGDKGSQAVFMKRGLNL
jgi:hypothetical protein